jgi:serine phosphatase RsbU (regulator of sigma subunit)
LFYAKISIAVVATTVSLAISLYNILKRSRTSSNEILAASGIVSTVFCAFIIVSILYPSFQTPLQTRRINLLFLMLTATLVFTFFCFYPYLKSKSAIAAIIISLPGYALSIFNAAEAILNARGFVFLSAEQAGALRNAYLLTITMYFLGALIVLIFKSGHYAYRALRTDLVYLLIGMALLFLSILVPSLYLEYLRGMPDYGMVGALISIPLMLVIMNYAASDYNGIDMKSFYSKGVYWLIIVLLLLGPSLLIIKYNAQLSLKEKIPSLGLALILFGYLFVFFKYIRPRIEDLFGRGRRNLIAKLDRLFNELKQVTENIRQEEYWANFFEILAGGFADAFRIKRAHCFLYNKHENNFFAAYQKGGKVNDDKLSTDHPVIALMTRSSGIVYKPMLYYPGSGVESERALEFFGQNRFEVVMPCFSSEKEMIGLVAFGPLRGNKIYSKAFLSVLELYRIQFQHYLANALMLEQVRATQVVRHDQIVVNSIKNKIIPGKMCRLGGYEVESLYIGNSPYGGDYIDSMPLDENRSVLFMADASYSGIDSAIILLELYSVLHAHQKSFDSPHKILNAMNWVIGSSKFSDKYAKAACVILSESGNIAFSTAAFNPMLVYTPHDRTFIECSTKGLPVGVNKKSAYESNAIQLDAGSLGIIYSDGLAAAINDRGEAYSIERLKDILKSKRNLTTADLIEIIHADLQNFIKDKKQVNDVSIIIFKFQQ